jgi:hypothetical protein
MIIDYAANTPDLQIGMSIRNSSDTAGTNSCALGLAKTNELATCSYRLKVSSNVQNGYFIFVNSEPLNNGTSAILDAEPGFTGGTDISSLTVGIEAYGVVVSPGSVSSGFLVLPGENFDADNNASLITYPDIPELIIEAKGPNEPLATDITNTTLVTHKLNISNTTPSGKYSQLISYTLSPSF